ncbi:hypothetical protein KJ966_15435 [bacterium]|nr:hypothetical protein [bacterium]
MNNNSFAYMGYWAAFLNEVFMGIMAGVWLPGKMTKNGAKPHPINFLFKFLLVFLFLTTVCGSSMNAIYPLINIIQKQNNNEKVIEILHSQARDNETSLKTFVEQNQRTNSAISVRNQDKTKTEMKQLYSQRKSTFNLWVQIITIILIRFGVQMANLCCIWLVGWIYSKPVAEEITDNTLDRKSQPSTKIKQKTKEPLNDISRHQLPQVHETAKNDVTPLQGKINPVSKVKKDASTDLSTQKQTDYKKPVTAQSFKHPTISGHVDKGNHPSQINILQKPENSLDVLRIKNHITKLLQSRNEGISLSEIGKAIGEKEANLRDIINPHTKINKDHKPVLESILLKIERLYNEESSKIY